MLAYGQGNGCGSCPTFKQILAFALQLKKSAENMMQGSRKVLGLFCCFYLAVLPRTVLAYQFMSLTAAASGDFGHPSIAGLALVPN
jgi:hypothetical protein